MTTTNDHRAATRRHREEIDKVMAQLKNDLATWDSPESRQRYKPEYIIEQKAQVTAAARQKALRSAQAATKSVAQWRDGVEGRIGQARTKASASANWDELNVRSKEIAAKLDTEVNVLTGASPVRVAKQLRDELHSAGDTTGLRALRLASRPLLNEWRRDEGMKFEARSLSETFDQDEVEAVPGLAELLAEQEQADGAAYEVQRAIELAAREFERDQYMGRFTAPGSTRTPFEREAAGQSANAMFPEPTSTPQTPSVNGADALWGKRESA